MLIVCISLAAVLTGIGFFFEYGMVGNAIGAVIIALALALAIGNAHSKADYEAIASEREMLMRRLAENTGVINKELYKEIAEFNGGLKKFKQNADNIVTNWVTNQEVAKLDYIEIPRAD